MTDDLTDLEAAARAATPGPWWNCPSERSECDDPDLCNGVYYTVGDVGCGVLYANGDERQARANARYIAAANPAAILALIERLRRAEGGVKRYKVGSKWPEGISDGLTQPCEICGKRPAFDYRVSDEFWRFVVPNIFRRGVVCLPCLDGMAAAQGLDVSAHLEQVQFCGKRKTIVLEPKEVYLYGPND